jgi:hypothetical protein
MALSLALSYSRSFRFHARSQDPAAVRISDSSGDGVRNAFSQKPYTVYTVFFNNRILYRNRMFIRYGLVFCDYRISYFVYTVCHFDRISYVAP